MRFEFATATRIIFGGGTLAEVGDLAAALGRRALVVTGSRPERAARVFAALEAAEVTHVTYAVGGEPKVSDALQGVAQARAADCDLIIGFGGGSAIDTAKAIAALTTNPGDVLDYLEVIGQGKPITEAPLPVIAIPTTAGTGAEVTRNAVLASPEHRVKVSLRNPKLLPAVALVDPELTHGLPPTVTASTGMDALTQLIEPYVSINRTPLTDGIALEGLQRARSLRRAYDQPDDAAAREDMAVASLFGGLALANAKLGTVHGFAGPMAGMYPLPHGVVVARLLPFVMAANIRALRQREPQNPALARYATVARILTGRADATPEDGVAWVGELAAALKIPPLTDYGVERGHFDDIIAKTQRSSSNKGNPLALNADELAGVLEQAL
ncbi:MAG: iron-containing alcohol dehydrogenase [Chloroflexi bacterium]|nr:iron-containing alcohol dehydrogenase [Chloroflexota bacterium]